MIPGTAIDARPFGEHERPDGAAQWQPLTHLKPGEEGVIAGYREDVGEDSRLADLGLISGAGVRMVKCAPLGDPLQLSVRGFHLTISKRMAQGIWVKRQSGK
ncbi:MAG: ferrous iron transport protein A [candidate division KSB1 bacterium]|nr:ferrous iron transport protein A [candidate division KSB1 bacterium]MDZ7273876.1 ferrous iron transport protein A [candidate division KSB1 bacterium]MDZ7286032.1 ferrous iron transport protein A [candidate division KSB1 bacterium]MDZ7299064.1 ferrous iron transport protein A [candidate division KSB1 bacterium]MDZ7308201.1 ferrous iron transport protein A [candidate division KSB1 bacterium]